jgi:hypothetical protein
MSFAAVAPTLGLNAPTYVGLTEQGEGDIGKDVAQVTVRFLKHLSLGREAGTVEVNSAVANFSRLTSALNSLLATPEEDEFGRVRPSAAAVARARSVIYPLAKGGLDFPDPVDVGTDHDGDIRIVWENGPRFLELVVPYEDASAGYFYYSEGEHYDLQRDFGLRALRNRFAWLRGKS